MNNSSLVNESQPIQYLLHVDESVLFDDCQWSHMKRSSMKILEDEAVRSTAFVLYYVDHSDNWKIIGK